MGIFLMRMPYHMQSETNIDFFRILLCHKVPLTALSFHCSNSRAYKDSLDVQKHGGKIALPQHLHANLKSSAHRDMLTSI